MVAGFLGNANNSFIKVCLQENLRGKMRMKNSTPGCVHLALLVIERVGENTVSLNLYFVISVRDMYKLKMRTLTCPGSSCLGLKIESSRKNEELIPLIHVPCLLLYFTSSKGM